MLKTESHNKFNHGDSLRLRRSIPICIGPVQPAGAEGRPRQPEQQEV